MTKVSDLHTLWLKPSHLPADGGRREVTIEKAEVKELHPRPGQKKPAIVLSFAGKVHKMIVNSGNANRLAAIGGDDIEAWPGLVIGLRRGEWGDKATIIIEPATAEGNGKRGGKIG